jgi:hypothetical protein
MGIARLIRGQLERLLGRVEFARAGNDRQPTTARFCAYGHAVFSENRLCRYGHHAA